MAGSQEFKQKAKTAESAGEGGRRRGRQRGEGPGGRSERNGPANTGMKPMQPGGRRPAPSQGMGRPNPENGSGVINQGGYKPGASKPQGQMMGADAWNKQANRENLTFADQTVGGNTGSTINSIVEYGKASNSANQASRGFGSDTTNQYTNDARAQSNTNKENNKGFSDNRITNNTNFANAAGERAAQRNEGFSMPIINNMTNNAKAHREDNTAKATQFANQSVSKYLAVNKANQSVDINALDQTIRKAPLINQEQGKVQSGYTYGDMYSYGKNNLPNYQMPEAPSKIEGPDFDSMYDKVSGDIEKQKIGG